jgi:hypothetical protein
MSVLHSIPCDETKMVVLKCVKADDNEPAKTTTSLSPKKERRMIHGD